MRKPTNSLASAAISLGVDAEDLLSILDTLQEAKVLRKRNPGIRYTVNATCYSHMKSQAELRELGLLPPIK